MSSLLITSSSDKAPLINRLKDAIKRFDAPIHLIAGDEDGNAISQYFVDEFWQMPPTVEENIAKILSFIHDKNVRYIIPTRDGELVFWAKLKEKLAKERIYVMVSNSEIVESCLDKLLFHEYFSQLGINTIPTYENINKLPHVNRFVLKERYGAGSKGILIDINKNEAIRQSRVLSNPIFQPFISGKEFSIDIYVDVNHAIRGIIPRERLLVVNGESQISRTNASHDLQVLATQFAQTVNFFGHIIMQVLQDKAGRCHIIECNPRFGGASTLSIQAGLNSFLWFLEEADSGSPANFKFAGVDKVITQIRYKTDVYREINSVKK